MTKILASDTSIIQQLASQAAASRLYAMGYPFNPDQKPTRLLMVAWLHEMVRTNAVKDLVPSLYSHYRERTPIRTPARPKTRPKAKRTRPTK